MKFFKLPIGFIKTHKITIALITAVLLITSAVITAIIILPDSEPENSTEIQSSDLVSTQSELPEVNQETVSEVEQPTEKVIKYEGKVIEVPKIEVAEINSKEDPDNAPAVTENKAEQPEKQPEKKEDIVTDCFADVAYGIDVSSHQGKIDWQKVKASGVQFAIIRCGYRGYESGKIVLDACFEYNITNAYKNGIKIGIYFYSAATNTQEAVQEAAWIVELLKKQESKGIKIEYPVAYDFEEFGDHPTSRANGQTKEQVTDNAIAYLDFLSDAGYKVMHYCSKYSRYNRWDAVRLSKYDFWLAHYCEATDYKGEYVMWQYSSKGKVDGIKGNVDMDISGTRSTATDGSATFVVCEKDNISAYSAPNPNSEVVCTLEKDTVYDCLKTYAKDWSELYINGIYVYVKDADITLAEFTKCDTVYEAANDSIPYYSKCNDDKENIVDIVEKGIKLQGVGIYKGTWLKIKYENYPYYVKLTDVKEYEENQDDDKEDDTASETPADDSDNSSKTAVTLQKGELNLQNN